MNEFDIAIVIARLAHCGQLRRDGVTPYVTHPLTVAAKVSECAKSAAVLHDALEDCKFITAEHLAAAGIGQETIEAVTLLTKSCHVEYEDYIKALKANKISREVKIADIEHNLSCDPNPRKIDKYLKALKVLKKN